MTAPDVLRLERSPSASSFTRTSRSRNASSTSGVRARIGRTSGRSTTSGSLSSRRSTLGLVGHNGSGKSTLLKTIGGIIQPSSGTVERRGRWPRYSNSVLGSTPTSPGARTSTSMHPSSVSSRTETDRPLRRDRRVLRNRRLHRHQVKFYSSGMYVRLAFAVAIHVDPDLLLVDEVLAVGDEAFQKKCLDKIRSFQEEGRTIVFVSHSAEQICPTLRPRHRAQPRQHGVRRRTG